MTDRSVVGGWEDSAFGVFERLLCLARFAKVNFKFGGIDFCAFVDPCVLNSNGSCDSRSLKWL